MDNVSKEVVNPARTRAWLQVPGGSPRWAPAPQYDLPHEAWEPSFNTSGLAHVGLNHFRSGATYGTCASWVPEFVLDCGPTSYQHDVGVRLVDINSDGLTDVVWYRGTRELVPSDIAEQGVLLNTGRGVPTQSSSAWCASEPDDVSKVGGGCLEAAIYAPPAPLAGEGMSDDMPETTGQLIEVNGDGLADFATVDPKWNATTLAVWIHDPGATGTNVWRRNDAFDFELVCSGSCSAPHPVSGDPMQSVEQLIPRIEFLDVDGDGTSDLVSDIFALRSLARHGDLVESVDNGRGGLIDLEYDSMIRQRSSAQPSSSWQNDSPHAELWRPVPVVSRVSLTGPNIARWEGGATTHVTLYRYDEPRFCPEFRSDLGVGLVERIRPDGSEVEEYFYQDHGTAGRTGRRLVRKAGQTLHRYEANWELVGVNPPIPGSISDVFVGQLKSEMIQNEYGGTPGGTTTRKFFYDDSYGYNFLMRVETLRPSTDTVRILTPEGDEPDLTNWIIGLVKRREDRDLADTWSSVTEFTYTNGRVATEKRYTTDDDFDLTTLDYDRYGNLIRRTDANDNVTEFCYDGNDAGHAWCSSPAGQTSESVLVGRKDPAPGLVTHILPHAIFGLPEVVDPGYSDDPKTETIRDHLGRAYRTWVHPEGGGPPALISTTNHNDHANPPTIETFRFAAAGGENDEDSGIREMVVEDGFGGVWKTIREAGRPAAGGKKYKGVATFVDPTQNLSRTTLELPCDDGGTPPAPDPLCLALTGQTETPAIETYSDALGRPVQQVDTSRGGTSLWHYAASTEEIVLAPGDVQTKVVDVAWSQNAKGDVTRRSFDGDRVIAVEECRSAEDMGADCAADGRTLYGYHASGSLEIVYDVRAVAGRNWSDPAHQLRYHFDRRGRVVAIDDPDAGRSETAYDGVGNVTGTKNARSSLPPGEFDRNYEYDGLDRPVRLTTPEGVTTFQYKATQRQLYRERFKNSTTRLRIYDSVGRLARTRASLEVRYGYDLLGRVTYTRSEYDGEVHWQYDGPFLRRVCTRTFSAWLIPADPCVDEPEKMSLIISDVVYDELGRPETLVTGGGTREFEYDETTRDLVKDTFTGLEVVEHHYTTHDKIGNLLTWSTTSPVSDLTASGSITYDHRNRIESWRRGGQTLSFGYDDLGNLIDHGGVTQVFDHEAKPHAITTGGAAYTHDDSGNVQSITGGAGGDRYFQWDSADRLTCIGTSPGSCNRLDVRYDAEGNRLRETTPAGERYFTGPDFVVERLADGTWLERIEISAFGQRVAYVVFEDTWQSSWTGPGARVPPWVVGLVPALALAWGLGLALRGGLVVGVARRPGAATVAGVVIVVLVTPPYAGRAGGGFASTYVPRFVMSDPLGSSVAVFDGNGKLLRHTRYLPFGGIDADGGPPGPVPRKFFAGHLRQDENELVYMQARWMDPTTGTFLSVDPVVAGYDDPQSLNAYAYARNNPISFNDPTGMCVIMFHCTGLMPGFYGSMHTRSSSVVRQIMSDNPEVSVEVTFTHKVSVRGTESYASVTYDLRASERTITGFRLPEITPELGPSKNVPTEAEQLFQDLTPPIPSILPKSIAEIEAGAFQIGAASPERSQQVLTGEVPFGPGMLLRAGRGAIALKEAVGIFPSKVGGGGRLQAFSRLTGQYVPFAKTAQGRLLAIGASRPGSFAAGVAQGLLSGAYGVEAPAALSRTQRVGQFIGHGAGALLGP